MKGKTRPRTEEAALEASEGTRAPGEPVVRTAQGAGALAERGAKEAWTALGAPEAKGAALARTAREAKEGTSPP